MDSIWAYGGNNQRQSLESERSRLVALCYSLVGNPAAAEDLAHDTLLLAWRHREKLDSAVVMSRWLSATAKHVCLHWLRRQRLEASHLAPDRNDPVTRADPAERIPDDFDLEVELERDDLARLLDRAMALLPPETREVLIQKYVEEWPQAEVAARLGLTEGAVETRLHRGRLALRRILVAEFAYEAASFGLVRPEHTAWQETRIWCPDCGERRLWGQFVGDRVFRLVCFGCRGLPDHYIVEAQVAGLLDGIRGYKPAYKRVMTALYDEYRYGISGRKAPCRWCGTMSPLRVASPDESGHHEVERMCPACGLPSGVSSSIGVAGMTPEGRSFFQLHGRIRALPDVEVESHGVPAIVSTFESVSAGDRLAVVMARDSLRVIEIDGRPV